MARARGKRKASHPAEGQAIEIVPINTAARPMVKATKQLVHLRVIAIMRLRLKGASFEAICEYAQQNDPDTNRPWHLSRIQLRNYCDKAERMMKSYRSDSRDKLINHHLAVRWDMFAECRANGQIETALGIVKDIARIESVYPSEGNAWAGSAPITPNVNILVDLRSLAPDDRARAIASGAEVDALQLAALPLDEITSLNAAALAATKVSVT